MGKSNNSQPTHSVVGVEPFAGSLHPAPRQSDVVSTTKLSIPPAVNVLIPSQPPSPSLPTSSEYFDALDDWSPAIDDDGDLFYDASDALLEQKRPVRSDIQQDEHQYEGAAKGAIGGRKPRAVPSHHTAGHAPPLAPPPTFSFSPAFTSTSVRGIAKPTFAPETETSATSLAAKQAQRAVLPPVREALKRALVIGLNYAKSGLDEDKRLRYAVKDAELWQKTLLDKGVLRENITIITDENPEAATFHQLLHSIRRLVHDVRAGDSLFFIYSGHAILSQEYGPSILTADRIIFPRSMLEQELVMSIPAGADLQVVFDCCHSAGMIGLQYCVGRMAPPPPALRAEELARYTSESFKLQRPHQPPDSALPRPSQPFSHAPQHGSLYGISAAADVTTPRRPPVTPAMVDMDTFGGPPQPQRHPRGGVVAAPPMAVPTTTAAGSQLGTAAGAVRCLASFMGLGSSTPSATPSATPAPISTQTEVPAQAQTPALAEALPEASNVIVRPPGPRRACQGVVEGDRMPDYFAERKDGFVRPAGKVMVWAGTGTNQKAFEAYGRGKQGIVTKAMCNALAACADRVSTCREVWSYLVQEIDCENKERSKRDASNGRPPAFGRIQHAELWVSQGDLGVPLRSAGPVLDQPMLRATDTPASI
ncbi:unnamed protein product [Rhizoctonia solani]|uniref:Metacaspase-1 n=1 Tax=Rhizoctonia solani TaxID=456999 RepID=A0A8H2ZWA1_9AGAM|nr:unnamed protein product [Rhizoctonia solani]